jgi:ELWxxDGT repeat protein
MWQRAIACGMLGIFASGLARGQTVKRVADINPGPGGGDACYLTVYNDQLYFRANDLPGGSDAELWRFDGTDVTRAADIRPGVEGSSPWDLTVYGGMLYFGATGASGPGRLWRYDGSSASQAPGSSPPQLDVFSDLTVFDGRVFYRGAAFGTYGIELWKYNGASQTVIDLWPGTGSSGPKELIEYDGSLYMNAVNQQLWRLNAAADGADQVTFEGDGFSPESPVVYDEALYFRAYDSAYGYELWRYDGATTERVSDIAPGAAFGSPSGMTVFGEKIYFSADDGEHGFELWSYDTAEGAQMVCNINQNPPPSGGEDPQHHANPSDFFVFGDQLYFSADDGVHGRELWSYDGISEPQLVADIYPGEYGSDVGDFCVYRGELYFSANDGTLGGELSYLDDNGLFVLTVVPEPSSGVLAVLGLLALGLLGRRAVGHRH